MTKPGVRLQVVRGLGGGGIGEDTSRRGDALGQTNTPSATGGPALVLDAQAYGRTQDCVQCGLCLPDCPTYTITGLEADSPRGRIRLIKALADGRISPTASVTHHLDLCLDCRACETACPSNVVYHELIEQTRCHMPAPTPAPGSLPTREGVSAAGSTSTTQAQPVSRGWSAWLIDRVIRVLITCVFPYPHRLRLLIWPVRLMQRLGWWGRVLQPDRRRVLPGTIRGEAREKTRGLLWLIPSEAGLGGSTAAVPKRVARSRASRDARSIHTKTKACVGFFAGCVGGVLYPRLQQQAVDLLHMAGADVWEPYGQRCCGAIHHHNGDARAARWFARVNIEAFMPTGQAAANRRPMALNMIVNHVAGCGAMLKGYASLLRDDPAYAKRAAVFSDHVRDISEALVQLHPPKPPRTSRETITYHDACHLAHAQGITRQPREILRWVKGMNVVPLHEADMCCGAAGTYNLTQPDMAKSLAIRKLRHIERTGANRCATGNIGCIMHLQSTARQLGLDTRFTHPVTLLHDAYGL